MNWIIKLPNTFIGNEMDFIKEFLLYSIKEDKNKMLELKNRNEEKYKVKFEKFNKDELFKFPNFKKEGDYENLSFNPKYNK